MVRNGPAAAAEKARTRGASVTHVYRAALRGFAARVSAAELADLRADPEVLYVADDITVTQAKQPAQQLPTGVDRVNADLSSSVSGDGSGAVDADVAIIDGGFDFTHPDVDLRPGTVCLGSAFGTKNNHGIGIAGVIGAHDDEFGVVGVAPGARMWAVEAFDSSGSGSLSSILCSMEWVIANAALLEVVNMSWHFAGTDDGNCGLTNNDPLHQAICRLVDAGVTPVAAAGNESIDASTRTPAAYDEVITVSALVDYDGQSGGLGANDRKVCSKSTFVGVPDDSFVFFSNYGDDVDLIAPGVCVLSTDVRGRYALYSGTSFAAPHVAGAAALYMATNPGVSPEQVRQTLVGAGTFDYESSGDPDGIQEPLLNAAGL